MESDKELMKWIRESQDREDMKKQVRREVEAQIKRITNK